MIILMTEIRQIGSMGCILLTFGRSHAAHVCWNAGTCGRACVRRQNRMGGDTTKYAGETGKENGASEREGKKRGMREGTLKGKLRRTDTLESNESHEKSTSKH